MENKKRVIQLLSIVVFLFAFSICVSFATASSDFIDSNEIPHMNVSLIKTDPAYVEAGRIVNLWILFENQGQSAKNMKVTFVDNYPLSLTSENDRVRTISYLGNFYQMLYTVKVDQDAQAGLHYIKLQYSMGDGSTQSVEKEIPILIKRAQSIITIDSIVVEPEKITPGAKANVTITVKNIAENTYLKNLDVSLGLVTTIVGTTLIDLPFTPVGSSATKSISELAPHETTSVTFSLASYPSAESKLYKIPFSIKYQDSDGLNYTKTDLFGLAVNTKPELIVTLENTGLQKQILDGKVSFNLINKGMNNIKFATVTLLPSPDYDITSTADLVYVGNIDSDDFQTADFQIHAKKNDVLQLKLKVDYRDAYNQQYSDEKTIKLNLQEQAKSSSGTVIIVIILIVVVLVILYFVRRKRKQRM